MSDPLIGTVVAGRFRIQGLLGEGGMAKVYVAEQLSIGREVALKVIRKDLALEPGVIVRFRREVEAVSRLRSPHVITFYDFGQAQGDLPYIVMERLVGVNLRDHLAAKGTLHTTDVINIMRQVCAAVAEAHTAGVSHRDLKPANIFFCNVPTPLDPYVKVLDFGLAKLLDGSDGFINITAKQTTVGTPGYLAPEMVVTEREVDFRADLYSLGVMIYEMLVGKLPFTGKTPVALALAHAREPIPSAVDNAPHLPPGIDSFMQIALAKKPEDRFQDANTIANALATAVGERRRR